MEGILENNFVTQYTQTKHDIYEELKSRVDNVILNSMKTYLREIKVEFDGSSIDLNEFKSNVVAKLDNPTQVKLAELEANLNKELSTLIEELKDGSKTAFEKFAEKVGVFGKNTVEMVARGTAIKAAFALSPTIGTAALGTTILAPAVYRAVKDVKSKTQTDTQAALDVMLFKLCTVKEGENQRFDISQSMRDTVYNNLKEEGIIINKEDSTLFLRDISRLNNQQKERVVNVINNLKGNIFDVKEEMKKTKFNLNTIKKGIKKNIIEPISTAALYGMAQGGMLNDIAPDAVPAVITALGVGGVTGNVWAAGGSGVIQYGASKFLKDVPFIGEAIEIANNTETIAATTGAAVGAVILAKVIPGLVYKGAKGLHEKMKKRKEAEKGKYQLEKEVADKLNTATDDANKEMESRTDKDVMLDVVRDVLRNEGVEVPNNINTTEQLKVYLRELEDHDKRTISNVVAILGEVKEDSEKNLKKTLGKVAKTAYWGGILALAGLGMYDAFLNPGFLEGLDRKADLEKELEALKAEGMSLEEIKNYQDTELNRLNQELIDEIQAKYTEMRKFLPDNVEDIDLLNMRGFLNDFGNKEIIEGMNINTTEGLLEFFKNINPEDERLLNLMEEAQVNNLEDLVNNNHLKDAINKLGDTQYYDVPEDYWKEYKNMAVSIEVSGNMQDNLSELVNENIRERLSKLNLPSKDASVHEIYEYIKHALNNQEEYKDFFTYIASTDESAMQISDAEQRLLEIKEQIKDCQSEIQEKQGIFDGINSELPSSPYEISEKGAIAGAAIGTIDEIAKSKKGIFSKIKDFIKNKIMPSKKLKQLPPGKEEVKKENKSVGEKLGIIVNNEDLKDIRTEEVDRASKEEKQPNLDDDEKSL